MSDSTPSGNGVNLDPEFDLEETASAAPRRSHLDVAARTEAARHSLGALATLTARILTPALLRTPVRPLGGNLNQVPPVVPGAGSDSRGGLSVPSSAENVSVVSDDDSVAGRPRRVLIDGEWIVIRAQPRTAPVTATTYPKTERATWTNSDLMKVKEKATGLVLAKGDKLSVPVIKSQKDETILVQVAKLRVQVKTLKEHFEIFDMLDVFKVVMPLDVMNTPAMETGSSSYDLFKHYAKLNIEIVALSNHWYCRWADKAYFNENLSWSLQTLKANTEPSLWNKCHEEYESVIARYGSNCQGGPLMLIIILKRVINLSAAVIDLLKLKVSNLKISSLPGEDVDVAVSLITACYEVMDSASIEGRDLVPHDFAKTVYFILQTTSVDEFNKIFRDLYNSIQGQEDQGLAVEYPPVLDILTHASRAYNRIDKGNRWCDPVSPQAHVGELENQSGLTADGIPPRIPPSLPGGAESTYVCWNCGGSHRLRDCPKPRDEAKIEAAVQEFRKKRAQRRRNGDDGPPKHKISEDGKPLVLNKKGAYVADQRAIKAQAKATAQNKAINDIAAMVAGLTPSVQVPELVTPPIAPPIADEAGPSANTSNHIEMIRNQLSGMNLF